MAIGDYEDKVTIIRMHLGTGETVVRPVPYIFFLLGCTDMHNMIYYYYNIERLTNRRLFILAVETD